MTLWVVTDASIFLATVLVETYSTQAVALIEKWSQSETQLAAPNLFLYEVVATLRKSVHRDRITLAEGIQKRDILLSHPIEFIMDVDLL